MLCPTRETGLQEPFSDKVLWEPYSRESNRFANRVKILSRRPYAEMIQFSSVESRLTFDEADINPKRIQKFCLPFIRSDRLQMTDIRTGRDIATWIIKKSVIAAPGHRS
jgi:hypothetical protein